MFVVGRVIMHRITPRGEEGYIGKGALAGESKGQARAAGRDLPVVPARREDAASWAAMT